MSTGTVKWFSQDKGYGFIVPDTRGAADIFVHTSGIAPDNEITEKDRVNYDTGTNKGKTCAVNVRLLNN